MRRCRWTKVRWAGLGLSCYRYESWAKAYVFLRPKREAHTTRLNAYISESALREKASAVYCASSRPTSCGMKGWESARP